MRVSTPYRIASVHIRASLIEQPKESTVKMLLSIAGNMVIGLALLALSAPSMAAPGNEDKETTNSVGPVIITSKSGLSDRQVSAEVRSQINERPSLRFFNIVVYVVDRDVYLKGIVDTPVDRCMAGVIAGAVPGVKVVHNELAMYGS
jgi:osmotically-inducible protein OsmY